MCNCKKKIKPIGKPIGWVKPNTNMEDKKDGKDN